MNDVASTATSSSARRWQTFADIVGVTLGVNVWISVVVLPAAFVGALAGWRLAAALLPIAVLAVGLWRRSEAVLLGLFPASVLVPIAATPAMASQFVYGPVRFVLVAAGTVAYLFGVAFFTTFHEPPRPRSVRGLTSAAAGTPHRWRRRERVYWMVVVVAVLFPAILLGWVLFDSKIQSYIGQMYPGRVALMTTGLAVGALAFWLFIYQYVLLGVLRPHRTGDRELLTEIAMIKQQSSSGRPRSGFYLGVAIAIIAMAALLMRQH